MQHMAGSPVGRGQPQAEPEGVVRAGRPGEAVEVEGDREARGAEVRAAVVQGHEVVETLGLEAAQGHEGDHAAEHRGYHDFHGAEGHAKWKEEYEAYQHAHGHGEEHGRQHMPAGQAK